MSNEDGQDIIRYRAGYPFSYELSDRYEADVKIGINKNRISGNYSRLSTPPEYRFGVTLRIKKDLIEVPFSESAFPTATGTGG